VLAVAAAVALVGCGSAKDARRRDVNHYVDEVNRIETQEAPAWRRAQVAFQGMGQGGLSPTKLRAVAAAPAAVRGLRRRIAALHPPPAAKALHRSLLKLLDADVQFADEVARFGSYTVAVGKLETELGTDTRALSKGLAQAKHPAEQEHVLDTYAVRLASLDRRIAALRPPLALAPWDREQRARLLALRGGALEVSSALGRGDRVAAGHGLTKLRRAMARPAVTVADRAAIVAYDARLARLQKLAAAIARRRDELTREYS
jgi:hypothetical protein